MPFVWMGAHTSVCTYGGQRPTLGIFLFHFPCCCFCFQPNLSLDLELTSSTKLADQQAVGFTSVFSTPQHPDYRCTVHARLLCGSWRSKLMLARQAHNPLSHLTNTLYINILTLTFETVLTRSSLVHFVATQPSVALAE